MDFDRRVTRREFARAVGCGITWFRELERRGVIPPGKRDLGGKRLWWPASVVCATLKKLEATAKEVAI
jgi:hypothetical protein